MEFDKEPIIIYKRKSKGLVLGEFDSYLDFVQQERKASSKPRPTVKRDVYKILIGENKEMYSVYYESFITIRINHGKSAVPNRTKKEEHYLGHPR